MTGWTLKMQMMCRTVEKWYFWRNPWQVLTWHIAVTSLIKSVGFEHGNKFTNSSKCSCAMCIVYQCEKNCVTTSNVCSLRCNEGAGGGGQLTFVAHELLITNSSFPYTLHWHSVSALFNLCINVACRQFDGWEKWKLCIWVAYPSSTTTNRIWDVQTTNVSSWHRKVPDGWISQHRHLPSWQIADCTKSVRWSESTCRTVSMTASSFSVFGLLARFSSNSRWQQCKHSMWIG